MTFKLMYEKKHLEHLTKVCVMKLSYDALGALGDRRKPYYSMHYVERVNSSK